MLKCRLPGGRAPAIWTEEVVRLVKEKFVALAVDGRIVNFCNDSETEFLSKPTDVRRQRGLGRGVRSSRRAAPDWSGASCTRLEGVFPRSLERGLKAFAALPASEREPGAVQVPERGPIDPKRLAGRRRRRPGRSIVRVYNRQLGRTAEGELRYTDAGGLHPRPPRPDRGIGDDERRLPCSRSRPTTSCGSRGPNGRR